jgi:uncharacterized protein YfaS (alpha-2-macroglobulin family)
MTFLPKTGKTEGMNDLLDKALLKILSQVGAEEDTIAEKAGGSAGLASLALALKNAGRDRDAKFILGALTNFAEDDGEDGLYFPSGSSDSRSWHDTPIEAQALAVQAISTLDIKNKMLPRAVHNLRSRKLGAGWGNTRASGQAIKALAVYLSAAPEKAAEANVKIDLGGINIGTFRRSGTKLISGQTRWNVSGEPLKDEPVLTLTRSNNAQISGTVTVRAFMPVSDDLKEENNGFEISRRYMARSATVKDVEVEVRNQRGKVIDRYTESRIEHEYKLINDDTVLKVGDVVTVMLSISVRAGQRYICIEDARPSCLEPIASSRNDDEFPWGLYYRDIWIDKEERDTSMNFYIAEVDRSGTIRIEYDCVVVAGGKFSAMPARMFDMYDETFNGHSDFTQLEVE